MSSYRKELKDYCNRKFGPGDEPVYTTTVKEGPSHRPVYTSTVTVKGETYSTANEFTTKKEAQEIAALSALHGLMD